MIGKAVVVVLASVVTLSCARTTWQDLHTYDFEDYKAEFGKRYSGSEHARREAIFNKALDEIRRHNADHSKTWKEGVNKFTDWTREELKAMMGYDKGVGFLNHKPTTSTPTPLSDKVPDSVDWRQHGVVSAVKDQGRCGSCWTFAATETVESQFAMQTGSLPNLSEQNILDCVPNPEQCGGTGGCQGGTAELAYATLQKSSGMTSEWQYPYTSWHGQNHQCNLTETSPVVKITGFTKLPPNQYEPLLEAAGTLGPIAISVEAMPWSRYESGIFDGCNKTHPDIDHAVQLVGYGSSGDEAYWIVRNSWGPLWGEHGFIRLRRSPDEGSECGSDITPGDGTGCKGGPSSVKVCGTCGILFDTCYPKVGPVN